MAREAQGRCAHSDPQLATLSGDRELSAPTSASRHTEYWTTYAIAKSSRVTDQCPRRRGPGSHATAGDERPPSIARCGCEVRRVPGDEAVRVMVSPVV